MADRSVVNDTELAKIAYQGYGESVGFKNYQGNPMPEWKDLGEKIQNAWVAAIAAALDYLAVASDDGVTAAD